MIFFTADQHFHHTNIIKFCNRPFSSADTMDETIIERFNSVVNKNDETFHLGDFTFRLEAEEYLERLNGLHHLVIGNHDHKVFRKRKRPGVWKSICESRQINWRGYSFFLSHYAHRVWSKSHYGSFHLYGHSHGTLPSFGRSMDVGVDTNNFFPYSAAALVEKLEQVEFKGVYHHLKAFKEIL